MSIHPGGSRIISTQELINRETFTSRHNPSNHLMRERWDEMIVEWIERRLKRGKGVINIWLGLSEDFFSLPTVLGWHQWREDLTYTHLQTSYWLNQMILIKDVERGSYNIWIINASLHRLIPRVFFLDHNKVVLYVIRNVANDVVSISTRWVFSRAAKIEQYYTNHT